MVFDFREAVHFKCWDGVKLTPTSIINSMNIYIEQQMFEIIGNSDLFITLHLGFFFRNTLQ